MKQKINVRLSLIALIAIIATTIGITIVYYNLFQQQVRRDLQVSAQLLSDTGAFLLDDEEEADQQAGNTLSRESFQSDDLRITWIDADGKVLYDNDTNAAELENHLSRPEVQAALENGYGECVRRSDTLNMNTFYYALLQKDGSILRISTEARSITSVFFTAFPVILVIIIIVLLICIKLGHVLTKQLLRPINQMAENLDDPIETTVYKELEPFANKIRSQHENILSAARSRQDFTANISHELKTPLTAISGYAELIENEMINPEQAPHIAEQIHHSANRLLSLINDIIRLSELDHTEIKRNLAKVDLYEITKECCENMQMNAQQKKVSLSCSGYSAVMNGDKDLLKELVENLVQNAIRYNRDNGSVWVMVSVKDSHPVLEVKDNGIGIEKDKQERIFERFYRVDKSRSRETGGTGLGLAIVKHIAEIHEAKITVESEPGNGTKMTVKF